MKILITFILLFSSVNAFATGGFSCTGIFLHNNYESAIQISAGTSRVVGNPMFTNLTVNLEDYTFVIPKERVVGYWNTDALFLINVADSDYNNSEIKLSFNTDLKKGIMKVNSHGINSTTKKVKCIFE